MDPNSKPNFGSEAAGSSELIQDLNQKVNLLEQEIEMMEDHHKKELQ